MSPWVILAIIIIVILMNNAGGRRSRLRRGGSQWGGGSWSGWNSGVGPLAAEGASVEGASAAGLGVRRRTKWRWRRRRELVESPYGHLTRAALLCSPVILAASLLSGCSYNRFVSQEEAVKAQFAQVQNQLQRRNDLIPNLVETVKGYASHEKEVFRADCRVTREAVGRADAGRHDRRGEPAERRTLAAARHRRAVSQPESERTIQSLSDELAGTKTGLRSSACATTSACRSTTQAGGSFPGVITAKIFSFKDYPLFEAPPPPSRCRKWAF
jgi:LemA protein